VEVCPVECFYEGTDQLYIHPEECIDCAACEPVCPVTAIFPEENVPDQWKSYTEKQAEWIKEHPEAPHALTKPMLGEQDNFAHTFTVEGKTITLPPPPSGFGGPAPPAPKAEARAAPAAPPKGEGPAAPKAEAPPVPPKAEAPKPEAAVPKAAAPARPVTAAPDDVITKIAEAAAAAAEAAARAAEAAAAAIRMLQGKADGRAGFGAPSAPAARPHVGTPPKPVEAKAPPKAEAPAAPSAPLQRQVAEVKPVGPDPSFDRGKEVLYSLIDFESGSREVNVEELSRAEETATRLFEEIAKAVGKREYDLIKDLEKKDVVLRQKLELANAILDRVARVQLQAEIKRHRARTREQIPGAVIAFAIAGACSVLGLLYALKYSFTTPDTLPLQDLLTAPFTPEGFMPFLGFNLLAGLFALFGLGALSKLGRSWVEVCHLEALLPKEFGAASLRPKRWSWVYRLKIKSERIMEAQKMLQALAAKKR
jgi:hypothetical protein